MPENIPSLPVFRRQQKSGQPVTEPDLSAPPAVTNPIIRQPVNQPVITPYISISHPEAQTDPAYAYATLWQRTVSELIDDLVVCTINFLLYFIITFILTITSVLMPNGKLDDLLITISIQASNTLFWLFIPIYFAYRILAILKSGQTIGKKLLGIEVVSDTDQKFLSAGQVIYRETLAKTATLLSLGTGIILMYKDGKSQMLHDRIAHTSVIQSHRTVVKNLFG